MPEPGYTADTDHGPTLNSMERAVRDAYLGGLRALRS